MIRDRSPSSRRAWIEIVSPERQKGGNAVALLAEGVDRNWLVQAVSVHGGLSPSSRRAWIEMWPMRLCSDLINWSPSSRRAWIEIAWPLGSGPRTNVALLAEGVDRNILTRWAVVSPSRVALLAEGVDRNLSDPVCGDPGLLSPSSRRAWIEICQKRGAAQWRTGSPSSRRAWIEMS